MEVSTSLQRNIDSFKNYLLNIWGHDKPLCKLFSTEKNNYLYDTGTNKILKCENPEFELLNDLMIMDVNDAVDKFSSNHSDPISMKTLSSLDQAMEKENILKITKIDGFEILNHIDIVIDKINNNLGMLQLEVTENCNLRCRYCVYDQFFREKRNHANVSMTEEIARKAIDYLKNHSRKVDKVVISFYGGEPLLKYNLIKSTVSYAKSQIKKKIHFSMTTNATLVNKEIASFLSTENFSVFVSLDGPEDIHDSWRKDKKGGGSFKRTLKGLCILNDAYKNSPERLGINIVYAPPYSKLKLDKIHDFMTSNECIPNYSNFHISYPEPGSIPHNYINKNGINHINDTSLLDWIMNNYYKDYQENKKNNNPLTRSIEKSLAMILQRPIFDTPVKMAPLNGCCLPAVRKLFITATGGIELCERINKAPKVGNIHDGLDLNIIKKNYLEDYAEKSMSECSKCWMARMCPICYQHAFVNNKINIERKKAHCYSNKIAKEKEMKFFCKLTELRKNSLDYLYKIQFS